MKSTDNGRVKSKMDAGMEPRTHQKPSAGQDVPQNDHIINNPDPGRVTPTDTPDVMHGMRGEPVAPHPARKR